MQCAFVDWLSEQVANGKRIKFTAIPNSTFTKSWSVKARNAKQGLRPGLPDMFLIVDGTPLWIEFKAAKGRLSDFQKWWIAELEGAEQFVRVCRSVDEAVDAVNKLLWLPPK